MTPRNKRERDIIKRIKKMTDSYLFDRTNSGHLKAIFFGADGERATVTISGSPSDARAEKNANNDIMKAMKTCNLI